MAVLRFNPNEPLEVALKFDGGKRVTSRIPDAPDQMMYSLCGDDTIYVPLIVAEQIDKLGIKKMELISICKTVRSNVTRWEVARMGDTATAPIAPATPFEQPTVLENQLTRSIAIAQQRQAVTPSKVQPAVAVSQSAAISAHAPQTQPIIAHTVASKLMAGALIAAFNATQEAERYAHTNGVELEFGTEDIRAIAATMFIQAAKDPAFLSSQPAKVNGGTTWQ
jgi:hypothetical protein